MFSRVEQNDGEKNLERKQFLHIHSMILFLMASQVQDVLIEPRILGILLGCHYQMPRIAVNYMK